MELINRMNENFRFLPKRIKREDLVKRILKECQDHGFMEWELHNIGTDDLITIYYTYREEVYDYGTK